MDSDSSDSNIDFLSSAEMDASIDSSPRAGPVSPPSGGSRAIPLTGPTGSPRAGPSTSPRGSPRGSPRASPSTSPRRSPRLDPTTGPREDPIAAPSQSTKPIKLPKLGPVQPVTGFPESIKMHEVNYDMLHTLTNEDDIERMRNLLVTNYKKISGYDYMRGVLVDMIKIYGPPGLGVGMHSTATLLLQEVAIILEESHKKWAMLDVPMKNLKLLKGSVIATLVDMASDKLSKLLEATDRKIMHLNHLNSKLSIEAEAAVVERDAAVQELQVVKQQMRDMKEGRFYVEPPTEREFLDDLRLELSINENLNSSLNKENYKLRKSNEQLWSEIVELEKKVILEHQEHLKEVAELCKDLELEEGIRKELMQKITNLTADPDEIMDAVNNWMKAINEAIREKQETISELGQKAKKLDDEIASRQVEIVDKEQRNQHLDTTVQTLREEAKQQDVEERLLTLALNKQRKKTEMVRNQREMVMGGKQPVLFGLSPYVPPRIPERDPKWQPPIFGWAGHPFVPIYEDSFTDETPDSPEVRRMLSPDPLEQPTIAGSPSPFASTPERSTSPYHDFDSGPSPPGLEEPIIPGPTAGLTVGAGTQTLSPSPRHFAPSIRPINPSTQTLGGVKNRFDIGENFNMQTVHSGSSPPYSQTTRLESIIPEAGPSRMIDSPLNIKHRAELTPDQPVTPFISKSRFGYTDPTAKVLNIPPGAEFDVPTGLRKTVVLTSPKRKEPLLVDIDVDPKPLTQTANGEHFVCDISLAVQQANKRRYIPDRVRYRHLSPVFTYDEPPEVTPTSDRRHGLFTPRGIFRRKHYNVRRVYKPRKYQSPGLPWSPHNLRDGRSPVSGLYPSPVISDSSIPWERGPESPYSPLNRTFDAPPPAPLDRTFDKSQSPLIKGPYYGRETPESDVYSSPSPVITGRYYDRETPESDLYGSPSPVIKRSTHGRYRSPESQSPSPIIKGPSYLLRSHARARQRSPSPTSESPSPRPRSPYDRSPSPSGRTFGYDGSIESSFNSHGRSFHHDQTFGSHQHAESYSPRSGRFSPNFGSTWSSYDSKDPTSRSSRMDQTYSSSASSGMDQTYNSPSPRMDQTYSESPSPRFHQTYNPSPSPPMNQAFRESGHTQVLEESFEESPLNVKFYGEDYSPEYKTY